MEGQGLSVADWTPTLTRAPSLLRIGFAVAAAIFVALLLGAWFSGAMRDPAESTREAERRDAGPVQAPTASAEREARSQLDELFHRCRAAAESKLWPSKVERFDSGGKPEDGVVFMSRRGDGLPIVEFSSSMPMEHFFERVTPPVRGHVGVSGRLDYSYWYGGKSVGERYFCDVEVTGSRIDVRKVSIETVR